MDLLRRAMGTATLPAPKESDGALLRQELVQAYREHAADPVPIDSLDRPAAAKVVLGRYVYLAQLLVGRLQHVQPRHLRVVEQVIEVLAGEVHPDVDETAHRTILGIVDGRPSGYAWDCVTSIFTAAFGGFSYDAPLVFGTVESFFRFASDTLAHLRERGGSVKPRNDSRPEALNSCNLREVDGQVARLEARQGTVVRMSEAAIARRDADVARRTGKALDVVRTEREAAEHQAREWKERIVAESRRLSAMGVGGKGR